MLSASDFAKAVDEGESSCAVSSREALALARRRFERLEHDFRYNLDLLHERDTELDRCAADAAAKKEELEGLAASLAAARAEITQHSEQSKAQAEQIGALQAASDVQAQCERKLTERLEQLKVELEQSGNATAAAQAALSEQQQDAERSRGELQRRLSQQRQQAEVTERLLKDAAAEERAQLLGALKAARAEAAREAAQLRQQLEEAAEKACEAARRAEVEADEMRLVREQQGTEVARRERFKEDARRSAEALSESQAEVLHLTRRLHQAELAGRQVLAEHAVALERERDAAQKRVAEAAAAVEREVAAVRHESYETMHATREASERRAVEMEAEIEQLSHQVYGGHPDL